MFKTIILLAAAVKTLKKKCKSAHSKMLLTTKYAQDFHLQLDRNVYKIFTNEIAMFGTSKTAKIYSRHVFFCKTKTIKLFNYRLTYGYKNKGLVDALNNWIVLL